MTCERCRKVVATAHDEEIHNTGECGCPASVALCWSTYGACTSPYCNGARSAVNQFGENTRTDERIYMLNRRLAALEALLDNHIANEDRHMPGTVE